MLYLMLFCSNIINKLITVTAFCFGIHKKKLLASEKQFSIAISLI